jgi:hypothetical protein
VLIKVAWYVENQGLVDSQLSTIQHLKDENVKMKQRLDHLLDPDISTENDNNNSAGGNSVVQHKRALAVKDRRIKTLEQQLKQLAEAAEKQVPHRKGNTV